MSERGWGPPPVDGARIEGQSMGGRDAIPFSQVEQIDDIVDERLLHGDIHVAIDGQLRREVHLQQPAFQLLVD